MRRRSFITGLLAAPVVAQAKVDLPQEQFPFASEARPLADAVSNELLHPDMIAKEALYLLKNNIVYSNLKKSEREHYDPASWEDDDWDDWDD